MDAATTEQRYSQVASVSTTAVATTHLRAVNDGRSVAFEGNDTTEVAADGNHRIALGCLKNQAFAAQ